MVGAVVFYKTTATGQEEIGHITYDGKKLSLGGGLAERYLDRLMEGVDRTNSAQVEAALQDAPRLFDGSYLRAAVVTRPNLKRTTIENLLIAAALKGGPGSGNWGHGGLPGVWGGSAAGGGSLRRAGFTQPELFTRPPKQTPKPPPMRLRTQKLPGWRRGRPRAETAGEVPLETIIEEGTASTSQSLGGGGVTDSDLVEIRAGDETYDVIVKPMSVTGRGYRHDGNSEVAAYRVAEVLEIERVPETVYIDPGSDLGEVYDDSIAQAYIADGVTFAYNDEDYAALTDEVKGDAAALDVIIGNYDRHNQNWLVDSKGHVWLIDHGHATWEYFEPYESPLSKSEIFAGDSKRPMGSIQIGSDRIERWEQITRSEWNAAFEGVDTDRRVDPDAAWDNLQYILDEGGYLWWGDEGFEEEEEW